MPAKRRSFVAVVSATERSFRAARVDHVFVGALAVAAFGVPRTTTDVDVIVDYREEDAARLAESFRRKNFQVSAEDLRDARAEGAHCTVHDSLSEFRVDIAPASRPRAMDAIRHSVRVRWRGITFPIAEDTRSRRACRRAGSGRDRGIFGGQRRLVGRDRGGKLDAIYDGLTVCELMRTFPTCRSARSSRPR